MGRSVLRPYKFLPSLWYTKYKYKPKVEFAR
jgi:hypothetical protein